MRIYRMTATFGKLEHETLTLEPGLNLIEAPNEWGKTTWCAFLITMLYGLATKERTKKGSLADKEKYAPWSGSPMAGRIDLSWQGRDITIERTTKGRTPLGIFRAYETQSGLAVPELTADNCGQLLLGVEQSVFRRTGFIRQSDLPVTQDDALRRRLNALVTTGDESGDSDRLAAELKELKNKCRYNRSGLIPQAQEQQRELTEKITELESLELHSRKLRQRLGEVKSWIRALENHADALGYAAAEADAQRVAQARDQRDQAEAALTALECQCAGQPDRLAVEEQLRAIRQYQQALESYRADELAAESQPLPPVPPEQFRGLTLDQAEELVQSEGRRYEALARSKAHLAFLIPGVILLALGLGALVLRQWLAAALLAAGALMLLLLGVGKKRACAREQLTLEEKYGTGDIRRWQTMAETYRASVEAYEAALLAHREARKNLDERLAQLQQQREALFGSRRPEEARGALQVQLKDWDAFDEARRAFHQAEHHLQTLQSMTRRAAKKPAMEDPLTYSEGETQQLLLEARAEQQHLQNRLGQYQGKMDALGDAKNLQAQLAQVQLRIEKLEETYEAVTLALDTLDQAKQELQRKFAPRISSRARELMAAMTGGRYDRLTLTQELSLLAGAAREDTLREVLWRSDGTVDQLYLALRLAVAEELLPDAPLVLDDAFVRFDDARLQAALEILKQTARQRQVLVFTCQHREKELLEASPAAEGEIFRSGH